MKKLLLSILFVLLFFPLFSEKAVTYERIYIFKIIAFYRKYEIYCTLNKNGYYKYPRQINNETVFLTYETDKFFNQCTFDENFTVYSSFIPSYLWSNSRGEVIRLKKRYGPVIDKNKERKGYPYGFGKN